MDRLRPRYWIPVADPLRVLVAVVLAIIIILLLLRGCSTVSPTPVGLSTWTPSPTRTALPASLVPTMPPTPTASHVPTLSPTPTASPVPTALPVSTLSPTSTASPAPTASPVPTMFSTPTALPVPTASPGPTPSPAPTASPVLTPSPTPVAPIINSPAAGATLAADKPGDISGAAAPGSQVQIWDGDKLLGQVTADASGKWSFSLPAPLATGAHKFQAVAVAANGQEMGRSLAVTVEVKQAQPQGGLYIVKRGDSLSKIAKQFYGAGKRWPEIYAANKDKIKDPNLIYPGQELRIP